MYGPTNFSKVLSNVTSYAQYQEQELSQCNQKYTVCLILTDGAITDFEETVEQVVKGSSLPLSIIIVGVGEADFSMMEALDGDTAPLHSKILNKYRDRDIV